MASSNEQIIAVAHEITRYFTTHPKAADSPEGIANWWLARQRIQESTELVERALEYLVQEGVVKIINYGGEKIYSYALKHRDDYH